MQPNQSPLAFDKKLTKKLKIALVRSSFHPELVNNLEGFTRATLITAHVNDKNIKTFTALSPWEIPILVQKAAESKKFDGIIALGIIVKDETFHFELVANEVTSALMQLSIDNHIPLAAEILAVSELKHAEARASRDTNNRGIVVANAILQAILTLRKIRK